MASMISKKCNNCKTPISVRLADHKRGWGRFCSKSCKAAKQEARTGQYRSLIKSQKPGRSRVIQEFADGTSEFFANFSNEEGSDI